MTASRDPSRIPRLHLVTDDEVLGRSGFAAEAERVLRAGGGRIALHLRGPGLSGRALWKVAAPLREIAHRTGSLLLINDRIDVALACGAGVQLRTVSIPVARARRLLPGGVLGVSVHTPGEARRAAVEGADFVLVGTLYETVSHPEGPVAGIAIVSALRDLSIPVIGIGGVTVERATEVVAAGGHGVAVIRGVWEAPDPSDAVLHYLEAMEETE